MKQILSFFAAMLLACTLMAQTTTLTFTGRNANNHFIPLNRVVITNTTKGWSETIYYPDTILVMNSVGIDDYGKVESFRLSQNFPNPFDGASDFSLCLPKEGQVSIDVYDLNGKKITSYNNTHPAGCHVFRVLLNSAQSYVLTARSGNNHTSIKMVNTGKAGINELQYLGEGNMNSISVELNRNTKGQTEYPFTCGDLMKYEGFAIVGGQEYQSQTIQQQQNESQNFTFQFSISDLVDGQPCPNMATISDYDGNVYNTVQIGEQCWMRENLRTTHYSNGNTIALGEHDSDTIAYRYCPDDSCGNVPIYGYLYNWHAMMNGTDIYMSEPTNYGYVQGVCPTGWHLPSETEWNELIAYVSSQPQYRCGDDSTAISRAMASDVGWSYNSNWGDTCYLGYNTVSPNNATGFSALPAGCHAFGSNYFGEIAQFGGSTVNNYDEGRVSCGYADCSEREFQITHTSHQKDDVYSVRCLRNQTGTAALPIINNVSISTETATSVIGSAYAYSDSSHPLIECGFCWSTSPYPTLNDNHIVSGNSNGNFSDTLPAVFIGGPFYACAYATNSMGTVYSNHIYFTIFNPNDSQPCSGTATVTDYDGNSYSTVQIGSQCWMRENIKTTHYADGTSIGLGTDTSTTTALRYYPGDNSSNVNTFGYLYNWPAVMYNDTSFMENPNEVQGICPTGWHVPNYDEWDRLRQYVKDQEQYRCRDAVGSVRPAAYIKALASTTEWFIHTSYDTCSVSQDPSSNNATGFTALPAGVRYVPGSSAWLGYHAYFWSSSIDEDERWFFDIDSFSVTVGSVSCEPERGLSVRCIKN